MALVEDLQDTVVDRFDRAGDEETAGVAQRRQVPGVLEQVLDLDDHVVGELREPPVQLLDDAHGVGGTIEEIRIAEGDVLCAGRHLTRDVLQHDVRLHDEEPAAVDRNDRAMAAEMLAAAAGLGVAGDARAATRQLDVRVPLETG